MCDKKALSGAMVWGLGEGGGLASFEVLQLVNAYS